jgi:serine/threonine-protein kinase
VADNALGRVHLLRRSYEHAIDAFTRARTRAPDSTEPVTQLGYALARSGRPAEARAVLQELEDLSASRYVPAYSFALIHLGLGQRDHALEFLQRSFAAREVQLTFIGIDTRWAELRGDPRFLAIVRGMGLE